MHLLTIPELIPTIPPVPCVVKSSGFACDVTVPVFLHPFIFESLIPAIPPTILDDATTSALFVQLSTITLFNKELSFTKFLPTIPPICHVPIIFPLLIQFFIL